MIAGVIALRASQTMLWKMLQTKVVCLINLLICAYPILLHAALFADVNAELFSNTSVNNIIAFIKDTHFYTRT